MSDDRDDALMVLNMLATLDPMAVARAVRTMQGAERVMGASAAALALAAGVTPGIAATACRERDGLRGSDALRRERDAVQRLRATLVALDDDAYPVLLHHIPDPPMLIYVTGELRADDAVSLAVVGARRCTDYGRRCARVLSSAAANAGLTIVSGGAYGIDAAAHEAALTANGRTIAVLGSGLADPYPAEHIDLFDAITDGRGAVISELPMHAHVHADNFRRRNRIISGLSLGVLVIEAAARSGALITARQAIDDHNRPVMVVPGPIDSALSVGCHAMLRDGAAGIVTSLADILDNLGDTGQLLKAATRDGDTADREPSDDDHALSADQTKILTALDEPATIPQLSARTRMTVNQLEALLPVLQLRGLVEPTGNRWQRPTPAR